MIRRFTPLAGLAVLAALVLGGQLRPLVLEGRSMEPTYRSGTLVLVWRQSAYAPGDVIAYHPLAAPSGLVIHRIIAADAGTYRTRGDNRSTLDPDRIAPSAVAGRAVVALPGAGEPLARLRSPLGLAGLALLFAASLLPTRRRPKSLSASSGHPMMES